MSDNEGERDVNGCLSLSRLARDPLRAEISPTSRSSIRRCIVAVDFEQRNHVSSVSLPDDGLIGRRALGTWSGERGDTGEDGDREGQQEQLSQHCCDWKCEPPRRYCTLLPRSRSRGISGNKRVSFTFSEVKAGSPSCAPVQR